MGGAACSSDREAASAPPFGSVAGTVADRPAPAAAGHDGASVPVDTVAMVGDSITVGSQEALEEGFASLGLDDVDIDAESGRRMLRGSSIGSGLDAVEEIAAAASRPTCGSSRWAPTTWPTTCPRSTPPAIDELLAAIPADAPLVWVDTYLDDYAGAVGAVQRRPAQVLAARGRATVVDWASVAAEDGVLTDGVHPSGFGVEEFTRRVVAAVDSWQA